MPDSTERYSPAGEPRCEDIEILLSGYLDDELTQQQAQRVRVHLDTCEHCRRIHKDLLAVRSQLKSLSYPHSDEAVLASIEEDLLARGSAWIGWALLALGGLIAVSYGVYGLIENDDRLALVFVLGGLALFISVLRQRLLTWKHDKYRKVKL